LELLHSEAIQAWQDGGIGFSLCFAIQEKIASAAHSALIFNTLHSRSKCNTTYVQMAAKVTWDENKNHGIDFSSLVGLFDDPL
jgi:hypothetical protein